MRTLFSIILIALLASSCTKDPGLKNNDSENAFKIRLNVHESEKNIFEPMEFNVYSKDDSTRSQYSAYADFGAYDSIVWKVSNMNGRFKILEYTSNTERETIAWTQYFFLPGEYETYLVGYKENRVVSSDTVSIKISNNKDFLGFNWADIKKSDYYSGGYANFISENYDFETFPGIPQSVPCMHFVALADNQDHEKELFDFITALYGKPAYTTYDTDTLLKTYQDMFVYHRGKATPINIWITSRSRIVLLKCNGGEVFDYVIYAEQNTQASM